jgi:hypothetical protein
MTKILRQEAENLAEAYSRRQENGGSNQIPFTSGLRLRLKVRPGDVVLNRVHQNKDPRDALHVHIEGDLALCFKSCSPERKPLVMPCACRSKETRTFSNHAHPKIKTFVILVCDQRRNPRD